MILSSNTVSLIVAAIYLTEGGPSAKHPYGINLPRHSAPITLDKGRLICRRTVEHAAQDFDSLARLSPPAPLAKSVHNKSRNAATRACALHPGSRSLGARGDKKHVLAFVPPSFVDFLSNRYCPPSVDPVGNRNWRSNMKFFLKKSLVLK